MPRIDVMILYIVKKYEIYKISCYDCNMPCLNANAADLIGLCLASIPRSGNESKQIEGTIGCLRLVLRSLERNMVGSDFLRQA